MLLDEPTAALSSEKIRVLMGLIEQLKSRGVAILDDQPPLHRHPPRLRPHGGRAAGPDRRRAAAARTIDGTDHGSDARPDDRRRAGSAA